METLKLFFLAVCFACVAADTEFERFFDWPDNETVKDDATPMTRIVGGRAAFDGQFPYQVSLRKWMSYDHYCGAAILNSRFILTAAHCTRGQYSQASSLYAVVGWTGQGAKGKAYTLEEITPHPAFDISIFSNDISLIRTHQEIQFSSQVWPINLPFSNTESNAPVVIAGWGLPSGDPGHTLSPILNYLQLRTLDLSTCIRRFEGKNLKANLNDAVICTTSTYTSGMGTCMGDSGGPLVDISDPNNKVLAGVVSWGVPCARGFPDVFTRVHSHLYWILSQMSQQVPGSVKYIYYD
ncbi:chymotrypsin-2-like [Sitodiplosis mosellana]|uniref:chymotrypsin-2-like n=1 Tax=Sitodiplosis mosellana TaxID=263140 RepID=UPI002444314E|nr:chymotrypsin-2-like [Sitodiplosis mosellana]